MVTCKKPVEGGKLYQYSTDLGVFRVRDEVAFNLDGQSPRCNFNLFSGCVEKLRASVAMVDSKRRRFIANGF